MGGAAMVELPDVPVVVVDTEGSGLYADDGARVSTVSLAWDSRPGSSIVLFFGQGFNDGLFDDDYADEGAQAWETLMDWLESRWLVFHNAAHDLAVIRAGAVAGHPGRDLAHRCIHDTMIGEWVLNPTLSASLEAAAQREFKVGKVSDQIERYLKHKKLTKGSMHLIPPDVIHDYAGTDAELTWRLFDHQAGVLETSSQLTREVELEMQVMRCLVGMERRGIGYDADASVAEADKARALLAKVAKQVPFTPVTEAVARKWFFEQQGATPHCVTKGGKRSVAECCVRSLISQEVSGAKEYAQYQKISTGISMWYEGYATGCGSDKRLRTRFKQNGTVSMRFSSTRKNLQAMPHDHRTSLIEGVLPPRRLFKARSGCELWEMDLGQAEARVSSKLAKCRLMLDTILGGGDIHGLTTTALFGIEPGASEFKRYRDIGKRANFSLIYLVGWVTFQRDVEKQTGIRLSDKEAQRIVAEWREMYPEFPRANRKADNIVQQQKYLKLCDGRYRWFAQHEETHKAFNQLVQGNIAQVMKYMMLEIDAQWPECLLLQIHDSLVVEIPTSWGEEVVEQMCKVGAEVATKLVQVPMVMDRKLWTRETIEA